MSRLKKLTFSIVSGYAQLAVAGLYSLAAIPLALHYLSNREFALWALMTSLNGYLGLIDLGMSGSIARLLVDSKDQRSSGAYGGMLKTGWLVLLAQGILLCVVCQLLAPLICSALRIEPEYYREFLIMVRWQGVFLGFDFAVRISSHILQAHQRFDILNYSGSVGLLLNFACLWGFFRGSFGVFSLVWAWMIGGVGSVVFQMLACKRLELFPERGEWGHASWIQFCELFQYGKDIFLVSLGTQLIMASQTIIVKRTLGLEAAASWAVGTKVFNLVSQVIWKPFDFSASAFAEMMARGEHDRLRERYRSLTIVSASVAGWAGISFAMSNSLFVGIWTHGKIQWPSVNDWLLGVWMIILTMLHCHNSLVLLTKRVGFLRYVYFLEGAVFVSASYLVANKGGFPAIIVCSLVCSSLFSGAYGVWRMSNYFDFSIRELAWEWFRPMNEMILFYLPVAVLFWWVPLAVPAIFRLGLNLTLAASLGGYFLLRFGIPASFQMELLGRVPVRVGSVLKYIFIKLAKSNR
jgi:O-antigen/teichoic acid export membrane protein